MLDMNIEFELPLPWKDKKFSMNHVGHVNFLVGPNGSGKSAGYRDFMGWEMPWYSVQGTSLDALLDGRRAGRMYIVCYLRQGDRVRDLLDDEARRRGDGQRLPVARHDSVRAAGMVGRFTERLAAIMEGRRRKEPLPFRWTSHRPVASREGGALGRSGNRHAPIEH